MLLYQKRKFGEVFWCLLRMAVLFATIPWRIVRKHVLMSNYPLSAIIYLQLIHLYKKGKEKKEEKKKKKKWKVIHDSEQRVFQKNKSSIEFEKKKINYFSFEEGLSFTAVRYTLFFSLSLCHYSFIFTGKVAFLFHCSLSSSITAKNNEIRAHQWKRVLSMKRWTAVQQKCFFSFFFYHFLFPILLNVLVVGVFKCIFFSSANKHLAWTLIICAFGRMILSSVLLLSILIITWHFFLVSFFFFFGLSMRWNAY